MSATMPAGVFVAPGRFEIRDRPFPTLSGPDEVLLEVEVTGVCGTDLHILSDPPGHPANPGTILGHEIVGRVVGVGAEVEQVTPGQRVVVDPNLKCGLCRPCRMGRWNHCENWTTIGIFRDGGFADRVVVPQKALHPLSDDVPLKDAVWAELLSCVVGSTDRIAVQPGQCAAVVGAGPAGMLHALIFQAAGATVYIADVSAYRLKLAEKAGLKAVDVTKTSLAQVIEEATRGWGADVVVDAVGTQLPACLQVVATGGTISLFGMNAHAEQTLAQNNVTRKELTVFGSFVGYNTFPRAVRMLESGAIKPSQLTTHDVDLYGLPGALESARRGEAMKVMVRPGRTA